MAPCRSIAAALQCAVSKPRMTPLPSVIGSRSLPTREHVSFDLFGSLWGVVVSEQGVLANRAFATRAVVCYQLRAMSIGAI
jgi:hypothetical protein